MGNVMLIRYKAETVRVAGRFTNAGKDHYCKLVLEETGCIGKMVFPQRLEKKRWKEDKYILDMWIMVLE